MFNALIYEIFFPLLLLVPAMSAEEDRLWSIVRANSLDFNAWTALIEETEKIAEVYHYDFFNIDWFSHCIVCWNLLCLLFMIQEVLMTGGYMLL